MAEAVHAILEEMVPELDDFEKKGLFTEREIKAIVKQRTNFEYALHRRQPEKTDFLRYVQYELNLDTLRRHRKKRLGLNRKNSPSDFAITRRLHFIFQRMLKKYRGDQRLWMQYFDFCNKVDSGKMLGKAFAEAVAFHPRVSEFWVEAAKYEFESHGNIKAARTLMQRGIRINKTCPKLWIEYFRLEMLYVEKIRLRREVLGIGLGDNVSKSKDGDSSDGDDNEEEEGSSDFLNYKIPKVVFNNAIEAIPQDIAFRMEFVRIYRLFRFTGRAEQEVYDSLVADFSSDSECYNLLARKYYMFDGSIPDMNHLQKSIDHFEEGVKVLPEESSMWEKYMLFFSEYINNDKPSQVVTQVLSVLQNQLFHRMLQLETPVISLDILSAHVETLLQANKVKEAVDISIVVTSKYLNKNADAYVKCINLCMVYKYSGSKSGSSSSSDVVELLEQALHHFPKYLELWMMKMDYIIMNSQHDRVEEVVKQAIFKLPGHESWKIKLNHIQYKFIYHNIEDARALYKRYCFYGITQLDLVLHVIKMESSLETPSVNHLKYLYEIAIDIDSENSDTWNDYVKVLRECKEFKQANLILQRAQRACGGGDTST